MNKTKPEASGEDPSEVLAESRQRINAYLAQKKLSSVKQSAMNGAGHNAAIEAEQLDAQGHSVLQTAVKEWWSHHPLSAVCDIAAPLVASHIREKPWQSLALAAGVGAVVLLAKPWRFLPIGAGIAVLARTTDFAGTLSGVFSSFNKKGI